MTFPSQQPPSFRSVGRAPRNGFSRFPLRGGTGFRRLPIVKHLSAAVALVAIAIPAHAEIFRCTASGGAVTYQEVPCPASAQSRAMDIPAVDYPEVNRAERERLLQREAALDARQLKRAQVDAAERIARDDRAARERESQALRDALAQRDAQSSAGPAFVLVRPLRPPRLNSPRHRPPERS
jgi:hypothetical protein